MEWCCRESARHNSERSTCCVHQGSYLLPARSTTANRVPVGGSGHWFCDALNHTATTDYPGNKLSHGIWHGTAAPASPQPFFRPAYHRWNRPSKSPPRADSWFYFEPGIDHSNNSLRLFTRANQVVGTRDETWDATLGVEGPSP